MKNRIESNLYQIRSINRINRKYWSMYIVVGTDDDNDEYVPLIGTLFLYCF